MVCDGFSALNRASTGVNSRQSVTVTPPKTDLGTLSLRSVTVAKTSLKNAVNHERKSLPENVHFGVQRMCSTSVFSTFDNKANVQTLPPFSRTYCLIDRPRTGPVHRISERGEQDSPRPYSGAGSHDAGGTQAAVEIRQGVGQGHRGTDQHCHTVHFLSMGARRI
ncbi:hypothetical protein Fuma_02890 [Fuerstiella marisgermanici]|uniref:Uncharacterized protein n=1 Tax=Fuerstiella marisgermanici TaxID=1891926 RepID=A0A1P8WGU3_9PLAN|nr:hypothetical protein Fuma_02890 [Fuerstiella marisgermanici]